MDNYTRLKDVPLYENPPKSPLATGDLLSPGQIFLHGSVDTGLKVYWR